MCDWLANKTKKTYEKISGVPHHSSTVELTALFLVNACYVYMIMFWIIRKRKKRNFNFYCVSQWFLYLLFMFFLAERKFADALTLQHIWGGGGNSCLKPNWHKQTTSKWRLLFIWWRKKGWGRKKREKIYLMCNCQESIFTCKIASEWERLPRGRNMTAFTGVRMDHHLQPPILPLYFFFYLYFSIFIFLALSASLPQSFRFPPPLPFLLILFSDSITLHFDNPAS